MPDLFIRITKRADGGAVLRCQRADGFSTWQRQNGPQGTYSPIHDFTHYAVESELGFRDGFYGLLAVGWDIPETEGKSPRGPLPPETLVVEQLVGVLDAERASGAEWSAVEINRAATFFAGRGARPAPRALTDDELARVRARARELLRRWSALAPGGTLELAYDQPPPGKCRSRWSRDPGRRLPAPVATPILHP